MKRKNYVTVCLIAAFFLGISVWNAFGEKADYSKSERRVLAKFPEVTAESVLSGKFSAEFEEYAVDAFPMRDAWRSVKAYVKTLWNVPNVSTKMSSPSLAIPQSTVPR